MGKGNENKEIRLVNKHIKVYWTLPVRMKIAVILRYNFTQTFWQISVPLIKLNV